MKYVFMREIITTAQLSNGNKAKHLSPVNHTTKTIHHQFIK